MNGQRKRKIGLVHGVNGESLSLSCSPEVYKITRTMKRFAWSLVQALMKICPAEPKIVFVYGVLTQCLREKMGIWDLGKHKSPTWRSRIFFTSSLRQNHVKVSSRFICTEKQFYIKILEASILACKHIDVLHSSTHSTVAFIGKGRLAEAKISECSVHQLLNSSA